MHKTWIKTRAGRDEKTGSLPQVLKPENEARYFR